jgi:hypothetical protein
MLKILCKFYRLLIDMKIALLHILIFYTTLNNIKIICKLIHL